MPSATTHTRPEAAPSNPDSATESPRHLTQRELSLRWQISCATLERWRAAGCGPQFLKLAGQCRYREQDVVAFEQASLRRSTSERA